jgi:RimJ/RimL family protein N-acetyltransferase
MQIETNRLILRKPKLSDSKDIVEGISHPQVIKMLEGAPVPYKEKDAIEYIKKSGKKFGRESYSFSIELKDEKKVIGNINLGSINSYKKVATTGSWVNKKYQKRGIMTEAKIAVNDFAFNRLGLIRLDSSVKKENKASNATQLKMGYELEGIRRKGFRSKASSRFYDLNLYGLLKEDWKKVRLKISKKLK